MKPKKDNDGTIAPRIWRTMNKKYMETFLLISIGAILGANLRYWLGSWIVERWGAQFPIGTLVINLTGSLIIGFFITLITGRYLVDPRWRIFFAIGFLGSYTTFSTYTFDCVALLQAGRWTEGLFNLFGGAGLGGLATVFGVWLGKQL